jgi:hypothetical protein
MMTCRAMWLLDTHKRDLWLYPRPERKPSSLDSLDWHVRGMGEHDYLLLVMPARTSDDRHDGKRFPRQIGKALIDQMM